MNKLLLIQIMSLASFHITSFRLCQWIITGWKRGIRRGWAALEKIADTVGKNVICIILQGKSYQGVNTTWSCCSLGQETYMSLLSTKVYIINGLWKHSAADFSATNYSILNRDGKGLFILQSSQLLQPKETSLLALPTWAVASTLASLDWGLIYIL